MQQSKLRRVTTVKSERIVKLEEEAREVIVEANQEAEARMVAKAQAKAEDAAQ